MAFIIGIFQFHYESEHKQFKCDEIKRDMCKSDSIFPYNGLTITVIPVKSPSFNAIP